MTESEPEAANEALRLLGLERAAVLLSEGFCPLCQVRGVPHAVIDMDDDESRQPTAAVNCERCQTRWRSGPNPESGGEWIEHSHPWGMADTKAVLTMTINPPPEPDCKDDHWWEDDDEEEV